MNVGNFKAIPSMLPDYQVIIAKQSKLPPIHTLLALDPGDTTGAAVFIDGVFSRSDEVPGNHLSLSRYIRNVAPDVIIMEDFLLYGHKADDLKWNKMNPSRLIGGVELLCILDDITLYEQNAAQGKSFVSMDKLRAWDLYHPSSMHHRDAIRHGIDFLIFGRIDGNELVHPGKWHRQHA